MRFMFAELRPFARDHHQVLLTFMRKNSALQTHQVFLLALALGHLGKLNGVASQHLSVYYFFEGLLAKQCGTELR